MNLANLWSKKIHNSLNPQNYQNLSTFNMNKMTPILCTKKTNQYLMKILSRPIPYK